MKNWTRDEISADLNKKTFNCHDTSKPLEGIQKGELKS